MQGLFGMQQPQQQANLLGNVFQSQAQSRQQGRNRLLGEALQIGLSQDPIRTGFAAVGGLLGQATGRAMGRITPEEAQQQKAAMIRRRIDERGISLSEDPYGFMTAGAEIAQEMDDLPTAMAFLQRRQEYAPEPVDLDPATFYNPETDEFVQGAYSAQGIPVDPRTMQPLSSGFVERNFETETKDQIKARAVNVRLPNAEIINAREMQDGTVVRAGGQIVPENAIVLGRGVSLAATQEGDLPATDRQVLVDQEIALGNYTDLVNDIISVYNENPTVNTLVAGGGRIYNDLRTEFSAIADVAGIELAEDTTEESLFNPENPIYQNVFEEIGLKNAQLQPLYLSAAVAAAAAEAGQSGRALSDKDVERWFRQQGASLKNPEAAVSVLQSNAERLRRNFERSYKVRTGNQYTGEAIPDVLSSTFEESNGNGESGNTIQNLTNRANEAVAGGSESVAEFINSGDFTEEQWEALPDDLKQTMLETLQSGGM